MRDSVGITSRTKLTLIFLLLSLDLDRQRQRLSLQTDLENAAAVGDGPHHAGSVDARQLGRRLDLRQPRHVQLLAAGEMGGQ